MRKIEVDIYHLYSLDSKQNTDCAEFVYKNYIINPLLFTIIFLKRNSEICKTIIIDID